jgi:hypothetical protein
MRRWSIIIAAALLSVGLPLAAHSQWFGQGAYFSSVHRVPPVSGGGGGGPLPGSFLPTAPAGKTWSVTKDEEFNGSSLDTSFWTSNPDGTGEFGGQVFIHNSTAVTVSGGTLNLSSFSSPAPGTTGTCNPLGCSNGAVISHTFPVGGGYFEARLIASPNLYSAFWSAQPSNTDCGGGYGLGLETDIMETADAGGASGGAQVNNHWDGYGTCHQSAGPGFIYGDASSVFHVYGVWVDANGGITYYQDGVQTYNLAGPLTTAATSSRIIYFQTQGNTAGTAFQVDWFRYYQLVDATVGACGSANGVATPSAPTTNLCSAGTASAVTGSGPWNWTCTGTSGPPASCSAPLAGSPVSLDNTIFTGSQQGTLNSGDTIVANITGCTPPNCTLGGADAAKFKVVAGGGTGPGGWLNSANGGPRAGPFLMSNGAQARQANGFDITINGTAFHLGDPAAPTIGTVTVLNPGANIQNAITAASSGTTIFLNAGSYSGGFNMKSGVNVVSATVQNHLRGQTGRATVSGGSIDISGGTLYGINFINCSAPCITGSNGTLTNNIISHGSFSGEWLCQGGNVTANWNSFLQADGMENACGGGGPFTFDRNFIFNCGGDCNGGAYSGSGEIRITNNFFNVNNTTDRNMNNLGSAMEYGLSDAKMTILNNYVLNAGAGTAGGGCCGGYGWSLIGEAPNQEFRYNYTAGHMTFTEVSTHINNKPNSTYTVTDNYLDWSNVQNFGPFSIIGNGSNPAQGIGDTGSPCPEGSSITATRNTETPVLNDFCIGNYTAGTVANLGIPAPFANGASPP